MRALHAVSIGTAFLELLVVAGSFTGWPSLQYVLVTQGYFSYLCEDSSAPPNGTSRSGNLTHPATCPASEESFNLVFQLAIVCHNVFTIAFSHTLDRFGTWATRTIACSLMVGGYALLWISDPEKSLLLYPAIAMISCAGLLLLITNTQLGNLIPRHRSLYVTLINGMFDSGSAVFLLFKIAYDRGLESNVFHGAMTALSCLCALRTFLVMPKATIPHPLTDKNLSYGITQLGDTCRPKKMADPNLSLASDSKEGQRSIGNAENVDVAAHTPVPSFKSCLLSKIYIFHAVFYSVSYLRYTFFLGGAVAWLGSFNDERSVGYYTEVLGYVLTTAVLVTPMNGAVADAVMAYYRNRATEPRLAILRGLLSQIVLTALLQILLSITALARQLYASFVFLLFFKSFLFGTAFNVIAQAFPSAHFGKLMGVAQVVVGVSSLLQYALFKAAVDVANGFALMNLSLLFSSVLCLAFPAYVFVVAYQLNMPFTGS